MNVLGVGIDLVAVSRMERILSRRPSFPGRFFSPEEVAYCDSRGRRAECYAARWAAREACAKALGGIPRGRWRDIRLRADAQGGVAIELAGAALARATEVGMERVLVSLAHERDVAIACCVVLSS